MTTFFKASVLAAVVGMSALSAEAAFTANDLYLGFSSAGASGDYLINLGQPGSIGVGGSSVFNLSGDFSLSLFNATFTSGPTGVSMGVVGGQNQFPSSYNIYATTLRSGGAGNPAVAGSDLSPFNHSQGTIGNAVSALSTVPFPTSGNGTVDANKTWTANVSPTLTAGSFYGASGVDPDSTIGATGILYEDLWKATSTSTYAYLGYFTMDLSDATPDLTFTPAAAPVPEPGMGSLVAIAGLSWLVLARKLSRKNKNV
jgi:hypothetical protein